MPNTEKFWNRFAKRYSKSPIQNIEAYAETMDRTMAHLSKDDSVLEVGCGTGSTALLLADCVTQITASDFSPKMIDIAKTNARDQGVENVSFLRSTPFDDSFGEKPYDAIMAFNFLHLLEDPAAAIHRLNELLKPGGVFISKTVCMAGQSRGLLFALPIMEKLGFAPYVGILSIDELDNMITDAGFEIIDTGVFPASPPSRFVIARKV